MNKVLDIVTSKGLTYEQKVVALAHAAENSLEVLEIPEKTRHYMETGAICDLDEGHAPYRPRYIMPDYEAAVKKGCEFLQLDPPKDLDEVFSSWRFCTAMCPPSPVIPFILAASTA